MPPFSRGTTSYDITGSSDSVRYPWPIVVPNGPAAARSGSTWIHWWSPVASANASIFSCGTSIQDEGPNSAPVVRSVIAPASGGLLDGLVGLVVGVRAGARDERRADTLRDRLLRDHALRHVAARRQLEHHVEERALDDRAEAAGARLAIECLVGDLPERVVGEDELDRVVAEEALVLAGERVLRLGEELHQGLAAPLGPRRGHREAADATRRPPHSE